MVKASRKNRTASQNKARITAHNDSGPANRKQLQRGLSKLLQKKHDVVKRKRNKKFARQARLRRERLAEESQKSKGEGAITNEFQEPETQKGTAEEINTHPESEHKR